MSHYLLGKLIVGGLWAAILCGVFFLFVLIKQRRWAWSAVLFLSMFVGIYAFQIEPKMRVTEYHMVESDISNEGTFVLISDLHAGAYGGAQQTQKTVDAVLGLAPDMVLIAGDFVWGVRDIAHVEQVLEPLKAMTEAIPTYGVMGNHDLPSQGELPWRDLKSSLSGLGVQFIDDEKIDMPWGNLIGLQDFWNGEYVPELLNMTEKKDFTLVLTHNPDRAHDLGENSGVDLLLAGHTHGGQIWSGPLTQRIIPTLHPFTQGWHMVSNVPVFVTRGLGMTGLPLRLGNPPVIEHFTLTPKR